MPVTEATYQPPVSTVRIGLQFGTTALPSANLRNADNSGRGYSFGYFDSNRNFVDIGAWTNETAITITIDRNMVWNQAADENRGQFSEGTSGSLLLGCFHVQLNSGYATFEEASTEAERFQNAFVRYQADLSTPFLVMIGQHLSNSDAQAAISALGLSNASVNSGTVNTMTVVRTGTNNIIFEFDRGSTPFAVMPRPIAEENPETWFRGFRYNGAFTYSRRDAGALTVINMVDIEDYVKGILPYEMANNWPIEALKAQALCARTYAIYGLNRHGTNGVDLCTEVHCQVYRGRNRANERTDQAVDETAGMYVTYNGQLVQTFFASSNGGGSENVENVWVQSLPYLRGVIDPYEADIASMAANYYWTRTYTPAELTARMRDNIPTFNLSTIATVRVTQYSPTGNVLRVTFTDVNGRQWTNTTRTQLIQGLNLRSLRFSVGNEVWEGNNGGNTPGQPLPSDSQYFGIDGSGETTAATDSTIYAITGTGEIVVVAREDSPGVDPGTGTGGGAPINGVFTVRGTGDGHQVGLSQWGAYSMAVYHDMNFEDIILFYFTGVEITRTH